MASPVLEIRLLGEFELKYGSVFLPLLDSARAESLLAYLILHRGSPQLRQRLAFLLWPDSTDSQAQTNLRHVLHTLRRSLPDPDRFIDVTTRTLHWRTDAPAWVDVAEFEELVASADQQTDGGLDGLRNAIDLYKGDLISGRYDEWMLVERERLRHSFLSAIVRIISLLEANGNLAQAIFFAEQLSVHDPLREDTYRTLMRLHAARGDRPRALRVYHACTATLARELGVEPSSSTQHLYEGLLPTRSKLTDAEPRPGRIVESPLVGRVSEW